MGLGSRHQRACCCPERRKPCPALNHPPAAPPAVLYIHAYCRGGAAKVEILNNQGMWYMDGVIESAPGERCLWVPSQLACRRLRSWVQRARPGTGAIHGLASLHPPPGSPRCAGECKALEGAASGAPACRPRVWREPDYELPTLACVGDLALSHKRPTSWARR